MQSFDPRQTACFAAAVQSGKIRAAAEQMGLEPSTVSRNISALETATATTLVERGRNGVRPTEAGKLLLAFLHQQESERDLLQSKFDELAGMKRGTVLVAVGEGFVGDLFDRAITEFSARYPDITFGLSVGSTDHVVHQVTSDQAHLGLAYNVPKDAQIRVAASAVQPLVALVRKGGVHDRDIPFDAALLAALPCAVPPRSFGIGTMVSAVEATHGLRLRALVETGSIAALKAFVRNDMGYAILPRFVVETELAAGQMAAHPIVGVLFSDGIAALIRSEGRKLPQAAQLFARQLGKLAAFN